MARRPEFQLNPPAEGLFFEAYTGVDLRPAGILQALGRKPKQLARYWAIENAVYIGIGGGVKGGELFFCRRRHTENGFFFRGETRRTAFWG